MKGRYAPLWLVLVLMVPIQLLISYRLQGPAVKNADAPPDEFSAARAQVWLQRLLGDQSPHPTGSEENDRVRERLIAELSDLGLLVEVQSSPRGSHGQGMLANVLARLPGTPDTGRPLVLSTHYDSVRAGPGAADAGSCIAALVETARAMLRGGPYRRPVYFLFTDGEEAGLLGAKAFVSRHPLSRAQPVVLNFDARGTSGPSLMYETHHGNYALVRFLVRRLPRPCFTGSSYVTVYRLLPNDTDFTIFQRSGWIGLNFAFIGDAQHYHTSQDRLENLSLRSLQHHGENALHLARDVATDLDVRLESPGRDAVFFDVLGSAVVCFPESWAVPLSLLPICVLAMAAAGKRRTRAGLSALLAVSLGLVMLVVISIACGWLIARGLVLTGLLPQRYVAHGNLVCQVYWLVPIVVFAWPARRLFRNHDRSAVWITYWLGWSGVGMVIARWLPGFSYVLLLPALAAALLSLLPLRSDVRAVLSTCVAAVFLLPMANLLPVVLGPRAGVLLCPAFALILSALLPFLATPPHEARSPG